MNALSPDPHMPTCPMAGAAALRVAFPRRVVLQDRAGVPTVYWGTEVIAFDAPALAPIAALLAQGGPVDPQRLAGMCPAATGPELAEAVAALQDIGILTDRDDPVPGRLAPAPDLPSGGLALDWRAAEKIGQRLLGRPIAPTHLEMIVPIFRIAHPMRDADGRQVGEANVFPRPLRQDVATDWQVCTYPGTRHRDDKPMNVTALKAMRQHWPEMMAVLARIRAAFVARAGLEDGPLTLGQIERLCIAVLALPTWIGLDGAALDPVLSSLFRVTDGLRIVVHQMMFVPQAEPMLPPEQVVSAAELMDYAERSLSFHSETGVCAGPQHFIREFLDVLVHGSAPRFGAGGRPGAAAERALADLDAAMTYGFAALSVHAAVFVVWTEMAESWAAIAALARDWPQGLSPQLDRFRAEAAEAARRLAFASHLGGAEWRERRRLTYAEMEREALRLSGMAPVALQPARTHCPDAVALARALPGLPDAVALAAILRRFVQVSADHLGRAAALQARISGHLGRPLAPGFTLDDMQIHPGLVADPAPRLQFLPETLTRLTELALSVVTGDPIQPTRPVAVGPQFGGCAADARATGAQPPK